MPKERRSPTLKSHAMQPDEMLEAILSLLEALCEKQNVVIPEWVKKRDPSDE